MPTEPNLSIPASLPLEEIPKKFSQIAEAEYLFYKFQLKHIIGANFSRWRSSVVREIHGIIYVFTYHLKNCLEEKSGFLAPYNSFDQDLKWLAMTKEKIEIIQKSTPELEKIWLEKSVANLLTWMQLKIDTACKKANKHIEATPPSSPKKHRRSSSFFTVFDGYKPLLSPPKKKLETPAEKIKRLQLEDCTKDTKYGFEHAQQQEIDAAISPTLATLTAGHYSRSFG